MGVENLSSSLIQSSVKLNTNDLASSLVSVGDPAATTAFLEQLAAQLAEFDDPDAAQAIVDGLNADLTGANSELQNGNFLPQAAIASPLVPVDARVQNDRFTPLAQNSGSTTIQAGVETPFQTTSIQDVTIPGLSSNTAGEVAEIERTDVLAGNTDTNVRNPLEKILTDATAIAKNEISSTQSAPRNTLETEKAPVLNVERPITEPEWKQELGDRVMWMSRNSMAAAELKVNPPQMGPVEVRINLNHDQMNVAFAAQNAAVREAIEAAVPRLREMLGGQQLNLINVDISHSFADQRQHQSGGDQNRQTHTEAFSSPLSGSDANGIDAIETSALRKNRGLLNYYV